MEGASFAYVILYSVIHFVKMTVLVAVIAILEESISKYRLYKIFDYMAVAFVLTLLGVIAIYTTKGIF
jgi:formate hydrogenlyase subunit 4